jgi:hypothetical protein
MVKSKMAAIDCVPRETVGYPNGDTEKRDLSREAILLWRTDEEMLVQIWERENLETKLKLSEGPVSWI